MKNVWIFLHIHSVCETLRIAQGSQTSIELWQDTAAEDLPSMYHVGWHIKVVNPALTKLQFSTSSLHMRLFTDHLLRFSYTNPYRQKGRRREKQWWEPVVSLSCSPLLKWGLLGPPQQNNKANAAVGSAAFIFRAGSTLVSPYCLGAEVTQNLS